MSATSRPILFSGPMVRALLDGTKTQTRRAVKIQPNASLVSAAEIIDASVWCWLSGYDGSIAGKILGHGRCPYGHPGDRLWVRETGWERPSRSARDMREGADTWEPYYYDADGLSENDVADFRQWGFKRRPSIHMPRWASRITLEITGIRVERLQSISEDDVIEEGITGNAYMTQAARINAYRELWERINGAESWAANPWVWIISFKRTEP